MKYYSKKYGIYWKIETNKDIFKGIYNFKKLQYEVLLFIKEGNKHFQIYDELNNNKLIMFFNRVSGEYVYGNNSLKLNKEQLNNKYRIAPSIDDLLINSSIKYKSPYLDHGSKKSYLFKNNGYDNFQGCISIDNNIFLYVVKIGVTNDLKSVFYDVSLQYLGIIKRTDTMIPDTNGASSILNASVLSKNNISHSVGDVKLYLDEDEDNHLETNEEIGLYNCCYI